MPNKNQVTLTFAGDESKLTQSFEKVGAAAKGMDSSVGSAGRSVGDSAAGFDKAAAASDQTYSKFDALESVGRGTTDTMSGLGEIMSGNLLQGSTDLAGGVAALADGFTGALLPGIKAVASAGISNSISTARQTVTSVAHRAATLAGAAATGVMTLAQRGLNLALRANPIGLVITAIALLAAGFVLAYKRSATFRAVVQTAMRGIQTAFGWVTSKGGKLVNWFKVLPGKIAGFFSGIGDRIASPFRSAFNGIRGAWNNTIGGKGFSFPGIAGHGAFSFRVPYFHSGGIVPGGMGSETLAMVKAGERITAGSNSGGAVTIVLQPDGTAAGRALLELLRKAIKVEGGNVQAVMGS